MEAREVIARRSDLSTFLVHLTRSNDDRTASENLRAILTGENIGARTMYGAAKSRLEEAQDELDSQKCVCFTETPLEYLHLLLQQIDNRQIEYEPYGVAIPKKIGRLRGVNPVWYVDMTPGHDWLTVPINELIDQAMAQGVFQGSAIEKLAPFIEQMGTRRDAAGNILYRKEFWWEREWRFVGDFALPNHVIVLCPEDEFPEFRELLGRPESNLTGSFIDPAWGLEQIISRLAGYNSTDTDIL